ncbi:L,D-transpeptidase [Ktedonosporobacter rubrisoli]|nr:L,D-transpeptidase [Ktedonosporobacter rubrisoli]
MSQISVPPRFCTQCGAAVALPQTCCDHCGAELDMRRCQPDDATIKASSLDSDATIKASSRLPVYLYAQAAHREATGKISYDDVTQHQQHELLLPKSQQKHKKSVQLLTLRIACIISLLLLLLVLLSEAFNHGSSVLAQQQAEKSKTQLDHLISSAQVAGVPTYYLQSVIAQKRQTSNDAVLLTLFANPLGISLYQRQAQQYQRLQKLIPGIVQKASEQLKAQALQMLQSLQTRLSQETNTSGNIHYFSQLFSQDQLRMSSAHSPKDYIAISQDARNAVTSLNLMTSTNQQLNDLGATLSRMNAAHLDVTAMQQQYQHDVSLFNSATRPEDFQDLTIQIQIQYQQLLVSSAHAFPYVSAVMLNELTTNIQTLRTYGINPAPYQKRLDADQLADARARTLHDQLIFLKQIDADIGSMYSDLTRGEASYTVKQFHHEVDAWNKAHPYYDSYDGHSYALDNGYMQTGIGGTLDKELASAHTVSDYGTVITEAKNALFNLHMLEVDSNDHHSFDTVHKTDEEMLIHYHLEQKQVLMVSLVEQSLRVYQQGKLVNAYQVTTGRQELPSLPGIWAVLDRKSPTIFTAGEPRNSPYWFPATPISYAILYHYGGYFVHDAPWRASYGPGTQFPHLDASGNTPYNFDGSHGCINLRENDAAWIYKHTDWNTVIVIY